MKKVSISQENEGNFSSVSSLKSKGKMFFVASVLLGSFVFGALGAGALFLSAKKIPLLHRVLFSAEEYVNLRPLSEKGQSQNDTVGDATVDIVKQASPAVVSILAKKDVPVYQNDPFGFFFGPFGGSTPGSGSPKDSPTEKQTIGGGTGFFVTNDGMIVTNKHVVNDTGAEYTVVTQDGKEYPAKVVARDPARDLAVVKVEGKDFPTLELGDSDALQVGETVIAIGNSLGEFPNSVSRGIVSGLKRDIEAGSGYGSGQTEHLDDIIQTDAAINPGNSGGPLLDVSGKVVGINTAVAEGAQGVGFALPINSIKKGIAQATKTGEITAPFLGVRYVLIDKELQKRNNLRYDYGALVLRGETRMDLAVVPGSPADKAGIVEQDIILKINGQKITPDNDLGRSISQYNVGETITLTLSHKGEEKDVSVVLVKRNE